MLCKVRCRLKVSYSANVNVGSWRQRWYSFDNCLEEDDNDERLKVPIINYVVIRIYINFIWQQSYSCENIGRGRLVQCNMRCVIRESEIWELGDMRFLLVLTNNARGEKRKKQLHQPLRYLNAQYIIKNWLIKKEYFRLFKKNNPHCPLTLCSVDLLKAFTRSRHISSPTHIRTILYNIHCN